MPPDCDARLWATRSSRRHGALIGVQPLRPHQQGKSSRPATLHEGTQARVDKLASSPPRSRRPTEVVRSERRAAIRSTQNGNQRDAERLAQRSLHTVVSQGVSACATSPLALRQAPARRPGPACRGSPVHALRAHRLLARGRCLPRIQYCCPRAGGKELCPLRTTRGSGDAAAGSRRGAPPRSRCAAPARDRQGGDRGGEGIVPDAWLS
jgi:hypothetical protein